MTADLCQPGGGGGVIVDLKQIQIAPPNGFRAADTWQPARTLHPSPARSASRFSRLAVRKQLACSQATNRLGGSSAHPALVGQLTGGWSAVCLLARSLARLGGSAESRAHLQLPVISRAHPIRILSRQVCSSAELKVGRHTQQLRAARRAESDGELAALKVATLTDLSKAGLSAPMNDELGRTRLNLARLELGRGRGRGSGGDWAAPALAAALSAGRHTRDAQPSASWLNSMSTKLQLDARPSD